MVGTRQVFLILSHLNRPDLLSCQGKVCAHAYEQELTVQLKKKTCILYKLAHLHKTIISCMLQQAESFTLNTICQVFKYQLWALMYKNNYYVDACV